MGVSESWGTLFRGPYNKDPTIWATIVGFPIFGKSHVGSEFLNLGMLRFQASGLGTYLKGQGT